MSLLSFWVGEGFLLNRASRPEPMTELTFIEVCRSLAVIDEAATFYPLKIPWGVGLSAT